MSKEVAAYIRKTGIAPVVAWTTGKDSMVTLSLIESIIPVRTLLFIDSGWEFPETYEMLDRYRQRYDVLIETARMVDETHEGARCPCMNGKIEALRRAIRYYGIGLLAVGIRRDEHRARASEKSVHEYVDHVRLHPILNFTEKNVWEYINGFRLEVNPLYRQGYRSLGCSRCTVKNLGGGQEERAGRATEKEGVMAALRDRGYF